MPVPPPASRLLNGTTDWMLLPFGLGYGSDIQSFTLGLWISSTDVSGVSKALISADGISSLSSLGLYWNNAALSVQYYWRPPGTPGAAGTLDTQSVAYATGLGVPTFIAVTGTGDLPAPASTMTFRFYAGTTPSNIVQVGSAQVAAGSIKSNSRHFAVGATTTGNSGAQATTGNFFGGNVQRIGYFDDQALTLAEIQFFAQTSAAMTVDALTTYGYPNGQVFEIWGENPENDHSLNFWTTDSITGTTVVAPIAPSTGQSYVQTLGSLGAREIEVFVKLDDGSMLASLIYTSDASIPCEVWKSSDGGASFTLAHTFTGESGICIFIEVGGGIVLCGGQRSSGVNNMYKSLDYGDTWVAAGDLSPATILQCGVYMGSGVVLAGTNGIGGQVFRSTDSGTSWSHFSDVMGTTQFVYGFLNLGGGVLLSSGGASDVYRSADSGATWAPYSLLSPGATELAGATHLLQLTSGTLLAGTGFGDLYRSVDSGATWTHVLGTGDFFLNFFLPAQEGAFTFFQYGICTFFRSEKFAWLYHSLDDGVTWDMVAGNTRGVSEGHGMVLLDNGHMLWAGNTGFFIEDVQGIYDFDLNVFGLFDSCIVVPPPDIEATCPDTTTIEVGVPFSAFVPVSGGVPPYFFELVGGSLPSGLTLNSETGEISGTPTEDGTFFFTIRVTDSEDNTAEITCGVEMPCPPFRIFWQDSNVRAHSWKDSGEVAYHTVRAFGGRHQIDGAKI